ncbi:endonuclease/exonuclease/phosphatase family protein, partial [Enterobacter cloacae complex sp. 4DZ3-17B2]|uniref:endonuclease/exonuclease/phosphatase family protein n=1 Tax=Enterobacter cloacae complex sp. 4DZ3-17B2 TaxID=2511990 RepID=UPI001CA4D7DB
MRNFSDYFSQIFFHVILITETWFNSSILSEYFIQKDYQLFRNDRMGKRGGGVAIYVHNTLVAKILSLSLSILDQPEYILMDIRLDSAIHALLSVIYCPPNSSNLDKFEEAIQLFGHAYSDII